VEIDLFGVNSRELVGGPPGLSLVDLGMDEEFSFNSCGPRKECAGSGV